MTLEQIAHAAWHETSQTTIILKCRVQDGAAVLATIEEVQCLKWHWSAGERGGVANTRYAAMRRARKALRG